MMTSVAPANYDPDYDPWANVLAIKQGTLLPGPVQPYIPPAAPIYDMAELRTALAISHADRDGAKVAVDHAESALSRVKLRQRYLLNDVAIARAEDHAADQAEVERMHAAAVSGSAFGEVAPGLGKAPAAEAALRPANALVDRLTVERDDKARLLEQAELEVSRKVSAVMIGESTTLALALWDAKRRMIGLQNRLQLFTAETPPDKAGPRDDGRRRIDLGNGNFRVEADFAKALPPRFDAGPTVARALRMMPGQTCTPPLNGGGEALVLDPVAPAAEALVWAAWARALRTDPAAEIQPIPSYDEAL